MLLLIHYKVELTDLKMKMLLPKLFIKYIYIYITQNFTGIFKKQEVIDYLVGNYDFS